ncbi:tgacg-sequence-specific DNA-binding protein tga-2.1 [Phtheirospermum japonicum]|uniref:Tgacg-sequence-specific DNA-binding protein tga-2.1 n=1 Tax=Phtheirospermum japonicum TaxID=374723 RepID=A0A830BCV3_9LAMI|nr:tgacg-sequence-specific DNA-binding protein tga-2.1 [Phtheirospermum japonicum]
MRNRVEEKFSNFYEKWMSQLENFVGLLLMVSSEQSSEEEACEAVYHKLMAHHREYYTSKWAAVNENVLPFFSSVWLSPLEKTYTWVTGWRPLVAFQLIETLRSKSNTEEVASLASLTEEQLKKIEDLEAIISADEKRLEKEMVRHDMQMASWKMLELVRLESAAKRQGDADVLRQVNEMVEAARKGMVGGKRRAVKMADVLRRRTLKGVLDVLTPIQRVDFLATTSMLQVQMGKWGKQRAAAQMRKWEKQRADKKRGYLM